MPIRDQGPTNPGAIPTVPDPSSGRSQVDYSVTLAGGQTEFTEEVVEETQQFGAELFLISSVNEDTLTLKPHNGSSEIEDAPSVLAAKPYGQQKTPFDGKTVGSRTFAYTSNSERVIVTPTEAYTEVLDPPYRIGEDLDYAIQINGPTAPEGVTYVFLNTEGRSWRRDKRLRRYKIVSVENDHVVAIAINLDGTTVEGASNENILKPRELRRSIFDGETLNNRSYAYTGPAARTVTGTGSLAGADPEDQIIIPPYEPDDVILAVAHDGAETDLDPVPTLLDINLAARAWAVVAETP